MAQGKGLIYTAVGAGLIYGLYKYFRKGGAAARLKFLADGLKISGGNIIFSLKVINVANSSINIDSIVGEILYNGSAVGVVSNQTPTTIAGNSEKNLKFKITPSLTGLGMALYNFLLSSKEEKKKVNFIFKGTVNAENILFDFEETYNF